MSQFAYQPTPNDEWDAERRKRMEELELDPHTIWPPSLLKQRALRERVERGELRDDTMPAGEPEMDPE